MWYCQQFGGVGQEKCGTVTNVGAWGTKGVVLAERVRPGVHILTPNPFTQNQSSGTIVSPSLKKSRFFSFEYFEFLLLSDKCSR